MSRSLAIRCRVTALDRDEGGDLGMGDTPKDVRTGFQRALQVSLLLLATVIVLNLTVVYLRPLLPWLGGALAIAVLVWAIVGLVRWRRSRW
jgi:membrane protein YdbS with pleckstrin-like domain